MKAFILIIILLIIKCPNSFGQHIDFETSYPTDTIAFVKLPEPRKLKNINSLKGKIVDTLTKPTAYIIMKDFSSPDYLLAIKKEGYYSVYTINIGQLPFKVNKRITHTVTSFIINICRCSLDNENSEELIIHFSNSETFDSGNGWSRNKIGYQILDLDKLQTATLINEETVTTWPYGHGMKATNSGMTLFFEYPICFKKDSVEIEVEGKKKEFIYSNDKLIRRK